jgi:hypothetical protein
MEEIIDDFRGQWDGCFSDLRIGQLRWADGVLEDHSYFLQQFLKYID